MKKDHSNINNPSTKGKLLFTNKYDYINPNDEHILHPNGVDTIEVNPKKRKTYSNDKMLGVLFIDACKLLQINGAEKESLIINYLITIKNRFAEKPTLINEENILLIYKKAFKKYEEIILSPKKRKVIFSKKSNLSTSEKQSITAKYIGKMKRDKTIETLKCIYKAGMTQTEMVQLSGKKLRTVKTYWKEIKV